MKGMNPMPNIRLCGLPKIVFAHIFGNDCYENILPAASGRIEIDYIKSGSLNLSQCDNTYTAHENDIICNLYKSPLQVMSPVYHSHNTVCFEVDFDICTDGDIRTYSPEILCLPFLTPASDATIRARMLIDHIIEEHTLAPENQLSAAGMFLELIEALSRANLPARGQMKSSESIYVTKAKKFIYTNLSCKLRQRDVASHLGISPQYLCDIFKKAEGVPLMYYINRMKLDKIRLLMKNEHMNLNRAAALYGYTDPNYVSRIYKKYYGKNITDA